MAGELPFLDLTRPGFSTHSHEVLDARDAGWCARTPFGLAVLRHREAGLLLRDRRLRQGSHAWPDTVGIKGAFPDFWRRSVISLEGPEHRLVRQVAQKGLSEDFILSLVPEFETIAGRLADTLSSLPDFDFVESFSEPFSGHAIAAILGRPASEAAAIGRDASTLGLAMGLGAKRHEDKVNAACERLMQRAADLIDENPGEGYVSRMLSAARELGVTDRQVLIDLVVISIFGGVDTTRAQLGFAIYLFATHDSQWQWLRQNPDHIGKALDEVIRTHPTTTWATREALEDFTFEGVDFRAGERVHVLTHATATDPSTGDFSGFDIKADRKVHFGFGGGAHHCLGHFVARTDMAAALRVLLRRWRSIRLVGDPEFLPDSGNTGPSLLRISPVPA